MPYFIVRETRFINPQSELARIIFNLYIAVITIDIE